MASSVAPVLCAGSEFSPSIPLPPFLCPCSCTGGKLSFSVRGFVAAQRGLWGPPLFRLFRCPRLCSPRDGVSPGLFPSSGFGCRWESSTFLREPGSAPQPPGEGLGARCLQGPRSGPQVFSSGPSVLPACILSPAHCDCCFISGQWKLLSCFGALG